MKPALHPHYITDETGKKCPLYYPLMNTKP